MTSFSGFAGKKIEIDVGEAAMVIDCGALGGKVSFGLISTIADSELSTDSPAVPSETVRTK